jgi:hypothetical protein
VEAVNDIQASMLLTTVREQKVLVSEIRKINGQLALMQQRLAALEEALDLRSSEDRNLLVKHYSSRRS